MCRRLYNQEEQKIIRDFKRNNKNKCHYCGKNLEENELTIDHIVPYSRGGKTVKENLVIACHECNISKSDMNEDEYIEYLKTKDDLISKDKTIRKIKLMMDSNTEIENDYILTHSQQVKKGQEKVEILNCIKNIVFNASEGYMLCRELKDCMIEIGNLRKRVNGLLKLKEAIEPNNDKLKIIYDELTNDAIKELRIEMKIGHLAEASMKDVS